MSTRKERRQFTAKEKCDALRQVIARAKTVSQIFEELAIHPNIYYRWEADFFEGALERFETRCIDVPKKVKHPETSGKVEQSFGVVRQETLCRIPRLRFPMPRALSRNVWNITTTENCTRKLGM